MAIIVADVHGATSPSIAPAARSTVKLLNPTAIAQAGGACGNRRTVARARRKEPEACVLCGIVPENVVKVVLSIVDARGRHELIVPLSEVTRSVAVIHWCPGRRLEVFPEKCKPE